MKITEILAWRVDLPFKDGRYTWSDGRFIEVADTTVVEVKTNTGVSGFGEICPLGTAYLPAYATGVRTGIAEIAPHLIGKDPRNLNAINDSMDRALLGHPYVKIATGYCLLGYSRQSVGATGSRIAGRRNAG